MENVENYRGKEGLKTKKIFKGGLREYWLICGCIVICDRCVFVLWFLDPGLGLESLIYSCNPLEPWPPVLLPTLSPLKSFNILGLAYHTAYTLFENWSLPSSFASSTFTPPTTQQTS
jgi:hypothetical protein